MKKSYVVGITGGSASGKTHLLKELLMRFKAEEVCMLSQDNYYKLSEHHPRDENGEINYDLPHCIDLDAFKSDIEKLAGGEAVSRREYLFQHAVQEGKWLTSSPAPILVVEGMFVFYRKDIQDLFDLRLFIEADEDVQFRRRFERDRAERNVPGAFIRYQWENHVLPAYREYVLPHRQHADMVIINNQHFRNCLQILENHFRILLNSPVTDF